MDMNSVLLDTSFIITLIDSTRANHSKAKEFYKHFIDNDFGIVVSTIVLSELSVKMDLNNLPMKDWQVTVFDAVDARKTGRIEYIRSTTSGIKRDCIKDDFKIISQALNNNVDYLITDDEQMVDKIIEKYRNEIGFHYFVTC